MYKHLYEVHQNKCAMSPNLIFDYHNHQTISNGMFSTEAIFSRLIYIFSLSAIEKERYNVFLLIFWHAREER